jgi:hypothetical protein
VSISKELSDSAARFKIYIDRLIALLERHQIRSVPALIRAFRNNASLGQDWRAIWNDIAKADGGKISLTTAGTVLGAVLGGVGIAAMGGAIGLPLALLLGLGGLLAGAEFDSVRALSQSKFLLLRVPKQLHLRIEAGAASAGVSANEIIVQALSASFPDPSELE